MRCSNQLDESDWKEIREKWRGILLSIPCSFSEVARSDVWKLAFNKRQAALQEHESLTRTAMQAAMEMASMKGIAEAQTGARLSAPALDLACNPLFQGEVLAKDRMTRKLVLAASHQISSQRR